MSQQNSGRYWLVVGLFLSLNTAGLVWIRHAWEPHRSSSRMVMLNITPQRDDDRKPESPPLDEESFVEPTAVVVPATTPKVIEPARIVAWLPISNSASALIPENVLPDENHNEAANFDTAERLMAVFDRPLVDERQLNRPLEHSPFHIKPQVPGHWRWTSTNRLAFVLDSPLPPGRKFELTAAVDFNEQAQAELVAASQQFQFSTRSLKWLDAKLQHCTRDSVTFELTFNQPVAPADLLRAIAVSDAALSAENDPFDRDDNHHQIRSIPDQAERPSRGPVFDATMLTKEADAKLVVSTKRPSSALRITLTKSLTGAGAELPLGKVLSKELTLPTAFAFVRHEVYPESFENEATVRFYFSTGLSADQEKPKIKNSPAVEDLRIEFSPGRVGAASYHAGVTLRGRFLCGHRYAVTLPETILSANGETLGETTPVTFEIPHRPADLRITGGQGILIPDGNLTLDMKCVNINGVRMSASRLHANNLAAFLQGRNDSATMRSIVHERQRSLDLPKDVAQTVGVDLRQLLKPEAGSDPHKTLPLTGIYRVTVADTGEYWNREATTVAITNLGITAKRGRDGWLAWVLSLRSATPQPGVTVTARSFNNQILATAITDASGLASLSIPENHPDGAAWLLTAERDGDMNYLLPDRHSWMNDTVDQSGRAWPDHYEAMLYAERGVYRPGDTVHLTGILRDRQGHRPPSFPLSIKVTRPDGRIVAQLPCQVEPDRQGVFHVDYPSSTTGQTGVYRFDVAIPGAKEVLGSTTAQIETFVPIRIAVEASPLKPRFIQEPASIHVGAKYLFGQPASGLDVTATGSWQRIPFTSKPHAEYHFGDFSGQNQQQLLEVNRKLGEDGENELAFALPQNERPGVWAATITATVTETGGRSVSAANRVEVDTVGLHIGVKLPEKRVVTVDEETRLAWVLLDGCGNIAEPRPIKVALARVDCDTTIVQVNGRSVWKSVERLIEVPCRNLEPAVDGTQQSLGVVCPTPGRYRLRLQEPTSGSATQIEFYASSHQSDRVDVPLQQPEQLEIVLDQAKYRAGDMARALIRAPFAGQLLLTIEGDRIYDRKVVSLEANSQLIDVPLPADLRGGAYITATVIRAIDPKQTDWLPHRAYGLAKLSIDPTSRTIPLTLEAASSALPGSVLKVRTQMDWTAPVEAASDSGEVSRKSRPVVHVWAVDEGILLTTRYATPKPVDFFHKPRKLAVTTADIYGNLLPDHLRPASMTRIGADAAAKQEVEVDELRRGPVDAPRRVSAVVWQIAQPVGDDGSLTIDLPVPQLTGSLRLMAVAVDGDRYGATEQRVTVTSPLLVESTWPRSAAPRDQFRVPVKLFNTTAAPLVVQVRCITSDLIHARFTGVAHSEPASTVTVEPNKPFLQWLEVTADRMGAETIRIEATATTADGMSLTAFTESGLVVRSATPLDSETTITRQKVGEPLTLEPAKGFQRGARVSIAVSGMPSADLNPALDSLIDYPHGCGEQTSSRLYALIAAQNWLGSNKDTQVDSGRRKFVSQLIDAGIVRLWSMQNRNGGIAYWNGGPSNPWISAYVAGAIIAARDAGHDVDPTFLSDLAKYLESVLDGNSGSEVDDNTRAQLCRILAAADKPKQGWMSRLSDRIEFLDAEGRAHLAAAWIRIGRKDRAATVLTDETFRLTAISSATDRITSKVRQDAVLLQVLLELDSNHVAIPALVERLQSARKSHVWMNTLENATAISALARYRSVASLPGEFTGSLQRGSSQLSFGHASPIHERWSGDEPLSITSTGQGEFYVVRTVEGLREQQQHIAYDRQLKVRRQWLDRQGREIDPTKLRVGDLVRVVIEVSSPDGRGSIPNVAIVDALPGGVEIENPRLATSAQVDGPRTGRADHVEFLDDRAVLFMTVQGYNQTFEYAVRVTTPGRFEWPPVQASSMYDPAYASVHGGGSVVIHARDEVIHDVAERPDENAANRN